jgi:voltage-gated potassium channel
MVVTQRLNKARELGAYDEWQRRTDKPMLIVSVVFLLVILVPVVFTRLPVGVRDFLTVVETILWIVFVVDYLVRFLLAPRRWRFFWTHIPELVVIAVPVLRPLRSLQVLRLLRLGGLGTVANRLARRSLQGRAVLLVTAVTIILVLTVAGVVLILERGNPHATITSYPQALWWAVSTVTTVGYGDIYPVTDGGRAAALLLMLAGIALVGIITAAVAAWFVQAAVRQSEPPGTEASSSSTADGDSVLRRLGLLETRLSEVDAGVKRILAILGGGHIPDATEHGDLRPDSESEQSAHISNGPQSGGGGNE